MMKTHSQEYGTLTTMELGDFCLH